MGISEKIYAGLPVWGQNLAVTAYGLVWYWKRLGPGFAAYTREFQAREHWSRQQWRQWREQKLRQVLTEAAEQVPFYQRRWTANQAAAARAGDLAAIPLLDKDQLRGNEEQFLNAARKPRRPMVFHTSGSTGTPIATHWGISELRYSMALREARSAAWAGVSFHRPRATFHGRPVVPDPETRGPFHRFNRVERQVYYSPFHLSPANAPQYVAALHRHRTEWLTGYAVSYYLLAQMMLDQGLRAPDCLKAVVTTSEKVTSHMRQVMEQAYGCPVFEEYSSVENISFASACEHGRLHVSPDAGELEILRPDGSPCDPGEAGEVVATGFLRQYQPLIRFRLGDRAAWAQDPCPCGRQLPVIQEVLGRLEDVVRGPDGRQTVHFNVIFAGLRHIREGQIIQETSHRIRAKVVPAEGWGDDDEQELIRRIVTRLGPEMEVVVEPVTSIPRTASGKLRAVVSLIGGERTGSE